MVNSKRKQLRLNRYLKTSKHSIMKFEMASNYGKDKEF